MPRRDFAFVIEVPSQFTLGHGGYPNGPGLITRAFKRQIQKSGENCSVRRTQTCSCTLEVEGPCGRGQGPQSREWVLAESQQVHGDLNSTSWRMHSPWPPRGAPRLADTWSLTLRDPKQTTQTSALRNSEIINGCPFKLLSV